MSDTRVLVYHPKLAEHYANLLKTKGDSSLKISVCRNRSEARQVVPEADILFASVSFPAELLRHADELKWVQVMGAGVERLALSPDLPKEILMSRVIGSFGPRMAEYAVAHMLNITQKIPHAIKLQEAGKWEPYNPGVLAGQTVGIAGAGAIGMSVAQKSHALDMRVNIMDISPRESPHIHQYYGPDQRSEFLRSVDFLVLAMPLTDKTRNYFDREAFSEINPDAWLINMARGQLVVERDLIEALRNKQLAGAVLDVFREEPLPATSPLWSMENVLVTPHIAGHALPDEVMTVFWENLDRYRKGEPLVNSVDLEKQF